MQWWCYITTAKRHRTTIQTQPLTHDAKQFLPNKSAAPSTNLDRFRLVLILRVEDPQDSEEQINDVEVEGDGRRNLLLNMVVAHNHLCVYQNVA